MTKTNESLKKLQADATVFYQKLRAYHWTVTGERFYELHEKLEEAYNRWADHIDAIAERIVINGGTPLLSLDAVKSVATIQEESGVPPARAMVEKVVADSRCLLEALSNAIQVAESEGQRGTVNLLDDIRDQEEKALWMLSAWLK
ncbi:MAG TPA: DNA starvation/stationary phase protection protein [Bryobacteraceae bacterium]|nr:DNA starvation/stationary phase protection protein [Bryobacteraceae bacterium]HPU72965.1 DNA starvation/stationary phase protection protein [Bryobacteraceae bacterium]